MSAPEIVEFLARDYTWEINTGTISSPNWVEIGGLNKWAHKPSAKDADTTKFSDAGRQSHMKASRGDEFTITGLLGVDDETLTTRDPGQAAVETLGQAVSRASRGQFKLTRDDDGSTRTFKATATVTVGGGGNDDPDTWEATLTVTGAITEGGAVAVPDVPTSVTPTGGTGTVTVDWTNGAGSPTQYHVVITDNAGTTQLAEVYTTGKPAIVAVSAGANRKAKVRAHNNGGWSQFSTLSSGVTVS